MENTFLKSEKVSKVLLIMVIPSMIAGIINQLNVVIDTYFLGKYAEQATTAQAATSSATSVLLLMTAFSILLALGSAIYSTQLLGEGKKDLVEESTANGFVAGIILFIVFALVMVPLLGPFTSLLSKGADPESALYLNSYYYSLVLILGYPTIIFAMMPVQLIRSEGKSTIIVVTGLIQILINIALDYILISKVFHGTDYEAVGAGIGTVVSQFFQAAILMTILFIPNKSQFHINLKKVRLNKVWFKNVLKNGVPQFTANILLGLAVFILGVSLAFAGLEDSEFETGVAAYGIVVRLVMMVFLLLNGAIQGVQGFFAYQYGSGLKDRIDEGLKLCMRTSIIFGIISGILTFVFSEQIAQIFTTDQDVIDLVSIGVRLYGITLLIFPTAHLCFGLFAALGYPNLAFKSTVIRDGVIFVALAIILPITLGGLGAVIAAPITHFVGSLVILSIYWKYKDKLGVKVQ